MASGESQDQKKPSYLTPQRIERLFKSIDTENKGFINYESIIANAYSPANTEEDPESRSRKKKRKFRETYALELIKQCDQRVGGGIKYADFEKFVTDKEMELWRQFTSLDSSGDGELGRDEVAIALHQAGVKLNELELTEFMKHVDTDNNGKISFEEWAEFLMFLPRQANMKNVYDYYQNMVHQTDSLDPILLPEEMKADKTTFKYLVAGAIAGCFSRTCTAPLDRLRVLLQVEMQNQTNTEPLGSQHRSASVINRIRQNLTNTWSVCKRVYVDGGILAFWTGNGVNILKIIPESAVRFYVYERAKRYMVSVRKPVALISADVGTKNKTSATGGNRAELKVSPPEITTKERMAAGGIAGFASQSFIYPLDTIKTRIMVEMQTMQNRGVASRISALKVAKQMYQKEGIRSFFRGIGPSLVGIVPYASIDLTAYETLKNQYIKHTGQKQPSPTVHLICGACAGALSCAVVYPLGLIRTRLQAQGTATHAIKYERGTVDVIRVTYAREGLKGFYKGLIPSLVKVVPAVSLSYICYEQAKKQLKILQGAQIQQSYHHQPFFSSLYGLLSFISRLEG
ncbi:hypothetical protein MP228_002036 [Amoeboaphelidium protococcarum]|nr:hypothetical protein MP228_002036 [Amoeboaphelidium protococcarum]